MKKCIAIFLAVLSFLLLIPCVVLSIEVLPALTFDKLSIESETGVTKNLSLTTTYNADVSLSWTSTNEDVITRSGIVNRPMLGQPDATVTIKATASTGEEKSFTVKVLAFRDVADVLEKSKNDLIFSVLSSENINAVTSDLYLPASWRNNTYIVWTSSNENLLHVSGETGVINQPPFREGLSSVILTAHIGYENQSVTKNFLVRVSEESVGRGYSEAIQNVRDQYDQSLMSAQNLLDIRQDLVIPIIQNEKVNITFISLTPDVLTSEGKVTRSRDEDKLAEFVVNFDYGYESTRLSYAMIVKAINEMEFNEYIQNDLSWVISSLTTNYNVSRLTENLSLPVMAPNGSALLYTSSNTTYMTNDGTIMRGTTNQTVTLTITAELSGQQASDSILITMLPMNSFEQVNPGIGGTGGASGSGGSVVGSGTGDVTMQMEVDFSEKLVFQDVPANHWAKNAIKALKEKGIISGDDHGLFRPNDKLTREELVKMVVLSSGLYNADATADFSDVPNNDWCYSYVASAFSEGIISGRDDGTFGRGDLVTRQDASVIIYNVLKQTGASFNENIQFFADGETIETYAKDAVSALRSIGLINGKGDNMFMPLDNLTRAEAATMIWRMLQK